MTESLVQPPAEFSERIRFLEALVNQVDCDLRGRKINFANSKTLVGRCRDRPSRALPVTCPNVRNLSKKKRKMKNKKIKKEKNLDPKGRTPPFRRLTCFDDCCLFREKEAPNGITGPSNGVPNLLSYGDVLSLSCPCLFRK